MSWYKWQANDLILLIRLQPKASKDEFVAPYGDDSYKIRITAPPIDGKANKQLIQFLAKQFKVPKKSIIIEQGLTGRQKRVRIIDPKIIPKILDIK